MSTSTENITFVYNDRKHEKRGDRWYICFGGGLEVSDAQNDLLDIAYEQSQHAPVIETAPESTEIKPSQNETVSTVESPQVIDLPLLPMSDDAGLRKHLAIEFFSPAPADITAPDPTLATIKGVAEPAVVESQDVFTDAHTTESLADALSLVSDLLKKNEELAAENARLTCASAQREQEIADLDQQVTRLDKSRARFGNRYVKEHKITVQARVQVREQKAAIKEYKTANEMLTGLNADLQSTVFSIAGAFGLLPENVTVANIIDAVRKMSNITATLIETRTEQPAEVKTNPLPFVQD